MLVLPTTYLGSIDWYRAYAESDEVEIEVMESFGKKTYRNRATIMAPNGSVTLSVPVCKVETKQLTRDIEISYQKDWQHQHWISLTSAYRRTPYFLYYEEYFRPWYERKTRFLLDLNEGLHEVIWGLINNQQVIEKTPLPRTMTWQGMTLEHYFGNGQSILDWLFEYGPETSSLLANKTGKEK